VTQLIPNEERWRFFNLCDADRRGNYRLVAERGLPANASNVLARQWLYSRQAMAALDVGAPLRAVQTLFSEAALASQYFLEGEPGPGPRYAFNGFFALSVLGDEKALRKYASLYRERIESVRKPHDVHLQTLASALSSSVLGDEGQTSSLLRAAKKLKPSKRGKAHAKWFASMLELARACLLEKPHDLTPTLCKVAEETKRFFRRVDIENQAYEPFLNRIALSLVARARSRKFDLSGPNPHPSMRLDLLCLPARKLPNHAWHAWPKPSASHFAKVKATLEQAARPK
jgi:hypothetical protein